jgi:hypothetical protein
MKQKHFKQHWEDKGYERGQALVILLFFSLIGITIISTTVMMVLANSLSGMRLQEGSVVYTIAQSGVENALLRLLRDPAYTGEVLSVGSGSATITVTANGVNAYKVLSVGSLGNFKRTVQADVAYSNNVLQITSKKEVLQ